MIISEKQVMQLIQFAQVYLNALDQLYKIDKTLLSPCGLHNKFSVSKILMDITNQQSEELKFIE
jgi:hypothetical protein